MRSPHIFLVKHMQGSLVSPIKPEGPRSRAWDTPDKKDSTDKYDAAEFLWYEKTYPTDAYEQLIWRQQW